MSFAGSEVEPSLAVNPANPTNLVAAWQQDRWSVGGGARGNVTAASFDGGSTWTVVPETKTSLCTGGTAANGGGAFRASDPWLTFTPDGDLFLASVVIPYFDQSAILVSKSTDGGLSWGAPTSLAFEAGNAFNDKVSITADPHAAGSVYAVWTRFELPNEQAAAPAERAAASRGPIWFARTTDSGVSWEPARPVYDPGEQNTAFASQIVVLPDDARFDGELVDLFDLEYRRANAQGVRGHHIAVIRSPDRGRTWSAPTLVAEALATGTVDPLTGMPIRPGTFYPDVAVDPATGALYAVWHDARFSGFAHNDIALASSSDGGSIWTTPIKVNATPGVPDAGNRQAFTPTVHVAADGSVAVTYYDLRNNDPDASAEEALETDLFLIRCHHLSAADSDRCADADGWTETRVTQTSFDLRRGPAVPGLFLGDYSALASVGSTFLTLFAQSNSAADPATVYFSAEP